MSKILGEVTLKQLKAICYEMRIKMVWSRPMAKSTYTVLRNLIPANKLSAKKIYSALCFHARSPIYLQKLTANNVRIAPGGTKAEFVTEAEAARAKQMLQEQTKKAKISKRRMAKILEKKAAKLAGLTAPKIIIKNKKLLEE